MYVSRVSSSDSSIQVFSWVHASHSPPPHLLSRPHPYLFIECFSNFARVNHSIVLLVKYNFSTINVTTEGSTKWSLTEGTLNTMLVSQLYSEIKADCS